MFDLLNKVKTLLSFDVCYFFVHLYDSVDMLTYLLIQVNQANVLFVDSPVGAGYSYVEDSSLYTNTTDETVDDLFTFIQQFYVENPTFQVVYRYDSIYLSLV